MRGLSLVAACGGHSSLRCTGLSLLWPLLLRSTGSRRAGSVTVAHGPSRSTAWGSSQTRARTRVPCIGRQILNHCATREAPNMWYFNSFCCYWTFELFPVWSYYKQCCCEHACACLFVHVCKIGRASCRERVSSPV